MTSEFQEQLKALTPAERKQVLHQIIKSGILTQQHEAGAEMEIEITITEQVQAT